jgi:hypothetical protein
MGLAADHIGVIKAGAVLRRARGRFADAILADMSVIALNPGEPSAYRELENFESPTDGAGSAFSDNPQAAAS